MNKTDLGGETCYCYFYAAFLARSLLKRKNFEEEACYVAYTCNFTDSLQSSHGWRRTGHLRAAGKVDSLGPVQSNQFLRRGGGGGEGCESCRHSFQNNDITTLTCSSSCAPAGQRYISMDADRK